MNKEECKKLKKSFEIVVHKAIKGNKYFYNYLKENHLYIPYFSNIVKQHYLSSNAHKSWIAWIIRNPKISNDSRIILIDWHKTRRKYSFWANLYQDLKNEKLSK